MCAKLGLWLWLSYYLDDIIHCIYVTERQICRERVGEIVAEKVLYVAEVMNRHEYVPKMPNQSEIDLIFDTSYTDVQPYLHRVGARSWIVLLCLLFLNLN